MALSRPSEAQEKLYQPGLPDDEEVNQCLELARNSQLEALEELIPWPPRAGRPDILVYVKHIVDPATGDTLLHIAAANSLVGLFQTLALRQLRDARNAVSLYHYHLIRRNYLGDTPLHSAAKSSQLLAFQGLYALFGKRHIQNPARPGDTIFFDPMDDHPLDEDWRVRRQGYLNMKNHAGNTALDEAKICGYSEIVKWVTDVMEVQRVGPNHTAPWHTDRLRQRWQIKKPRQFPD